MKHFIVATAGHVDHGKSALVRALTGVDPDRLPEEKARGITIDLGFAELNLRGPDGEEIHAGIIDVPGHEDFVRNMIAGVGSIDLALFVVAADDGWMPQSEEHVQILEYLGVTRAVIVLTKIDIADPGNAEREIREKLRGTAYATAPLVRTSLHPINSTVLSRRVGGGGVAELRSALASQLSHIAPQRDIGKPRLFVDRAFSLRGVGTVVTGTLTGGMLRVGDDVVVQPAEKHSRIRSLQSHGRDVDLAHPGTRTAINLPDLTPGTGVARGDAITSAGLAPTTAIATLLRRSPRLHSAPPIKSGSTVYFHHGTTRIPAKVTLLEADSLPVATDALARFELNKPALVFIGDRFVVRDASERQTIAGGVVLAVDCKREDFRWASSAALLRARAAAEHDVDLYARAEVAGHGEVVSSQILSRSRFSCSEIAQALRRLEERGEIFLAGNIAADAVVWRVLRERAVRLIDAAHAAAPERVGLELNELKSELSGHSAELVDALIVDLCGGDFARTGSLIGRRSHRAVLPPALESIAEDIRRRLELNAFDPPPRKQLAPDGKARQALKFLIEQNELVEINDEVVFSRAALSQIKNEIAAFISSRGPATVSQLRIALKTSRRVMVPLLERLDREGFTRRVGDERLLAQQITSVKLSDASIAQRR